MKKEREIESLIRLLDDPDTRIYEHVAEKLESYGTELIPLLLTYYEASESELQQARLSDILENLKFEKLETELIHWKENNSDDLLKGCLLIAQYGYPNMDEKSIHDLLEAIKKRLKPLLSDQQVPEEITNTMNQVILTEFGFRGNKQDFSGINNSFINKVFEDRLGNPIMLSIIYLLLSKELKIPLVGINSPGHFLIAFIDKNSFVLDDKKDVIEGIDFYIDPFNHGLIRTKSEIHSILKKANINLDKKEALYAENIDIVRRVMNNLIYGLFSTGEEGTAKNLLQIADSLS